MHSACGALICSLQQTVETGHRCPLHPGPARLPLRRRSPLPWWAAALLVLPAFASVFSRACVKSASFPFHSPYSHSQVLFTPFPDLCRCIAFLCRCIARCTASLVT